MTATPVLARGWGDYGGYRHHHRDRIDGGDILAGILVIGGIAAIASAASKSAKDNRERDRRYPDDDYRSGRNGDYRNAPGGYGSDDRDDRYRQGPGSGDISLGTAVDACVDEVERARRDVDSVDSVGREGDGYRVEGRVTDGRDFSCTVDADGRIRRVAVGGQAVI
ncbi:MAG: hypothetical protein KDE55_17595 [Novosphingobium sp.]|nr:hypothetical protein [Novosphingobium sp.]